MDRVEGTVVKLMDKGFGFISYEGSEKDLFFHLRSLQNIEFDDLKEGDRVSFEIEQSPKGPNAVNVERIGEADTSADDMEMDEEMEA